MCQYCSFHLASFRVCRVGIIDDGTVTGLRYGSSGVKFRKGQEISLCYVRSRSARRPTQGELSATVKRPLRGADYTLPFSAELKNNVNPLQIKNNVNPLQTKRRPLYLKTQSVPRCKHFLSLL